jgi:hypothetical protein
MPPASHLPPLALLLATLGCSPATSDPGGPGGSGGGKADDLRECGDADDDVCLEYRSFEVLFTNPVCETYEYPDPMPSAAAAIACAEDCGAEPEAERETCKTSCLGEAALADDALTTKPANVYCHAASDLEPSGSRPESPQNRIVEWIDSSGDGDVLFLSSLSFSDGLIADKLCEALDRGAAVEMVLDKLSSRAEQVQECGGLVHVRGSGTRFAHVKLIMVNPDQPGPSDEDAEHLRLAFGSGNLSTGTVLHHENWQFLEVARDSFFVEAHRCLAAALIDEEAASRKDKFRAFVNDCRAVIEHPEETDIKSYFIPVNEDSDRIVESMLAAAVAAESVDIAAHRFSFFQGNPDKLETEPRLVDTLGGRLESDPEFAVRLIADDDLYWLRPITGDAGFKLGPNSASELDSVDHLAEHGAERFEIRYMETNHSSKGCTGDGGTFSSPLLHHNKFLILRGGEGGSAVLTGAPNFTGAGFTNNFENVYMIAIPGVVNAYAEQYRRMWDGERIAADEPEPPRATRAEEMPMVIQTVNPPELEELCGVE